MGNMKLVLAEPIVELKDAIDLWISPTHAISMKGDDDFIGSEFPGQPRIQCYFGQKEIYIFCNVNMHRVNTCCFWNKEKEGRRIITGWLEYGWNMFKGDTLVVSPRWREVSSEQIEIEYNRNKGL